MSRYSLSRQASRSADGRCFPFLRAMEEGVRGEISVKSIASEALLPHTAVFREGRGVGFICAARPKNICHFLTERRDGILVISYATEK